MTEERESLERLRALLHDSEPEVRGMTAVALSHMDDAWATGLLVELLDDPDHRVRCAAISSLGERGDTAATLPLVQQMQAEDVEVRCCTLSALALLADERAFPAVIAALFDIDDDIRRNAAGAIGYLGDTRALEPLEMALDDPYAGVRANAALSLGMLGGLDTSGPLLAHLVAESDETVRSNMLIALIACDPLQEPYVIEELLDGGEYEKVRISACIALARAASKRRLIDEGAARDALLAALERADATDELRATAVWALGRMKPTTETTQTLGDALDDEYSWVVIYAVESLALAGDEAILESLHAYRLRHLDEPKTLEHTDAAIAEIESERAESDACVKPTEQDDSEGCDDSAKRADSPEQDDSADAVR